MDDQQIRVEIKSNTDSLSARAVHDALVHMVGDSAEEGADFLKMAVPHRTLAMAMAAGHHGPVDDGINVSASVGIPPIVNPGGSFDPNSMRYPMFVDKGTGIFGDYHTPIFAKRSEAMKLPPDGVHSIFQHEIKGQEGQFFMKKTFEFMKASMSINAEHFKAELKSKLTADKLE
jgi:hypothetical protein